MCQSSFAVNVQKYKLDEDTNICQIKDLPRHLCKNIRRVKGCFWALWEISGSMVWIFLKRSYVIHLISTTVYKEVFFLLSPKPFIVVKLTFKVNIGFKFQNIKSIL